MGVYIYESGNIAIRNRNIMEFRLEHRNAMSEHRIGTGTRLGTGTGTGTKPDMVILRTALVILKFKCRTKFRESQESV